MVCINYMSEIPNSTVLVSLMYVKTHLTAFAITTTFYVFTPFLLAEIWETTLRIHSTFLML